jgi:lipoic acid synthetase
LTKAVPKPTLFLTMEQSTRRKQKPPWLDKKITYSDERHEVKSILNKLGLNTVCKSARCPNLSECFRHRRATFLILGSTCTRSCTFCSIEKSGSSNPPPPDPGEPRRILEAVKELGLRYVVITSVTRDDLPDGGAVQFARCIQLIRSEGNGAKVEVLTPDFLGRVESIDTVALAGPDVFNHNVETVPRLYPSVRPQADYDRSIRFLVYLRKRYPHIYLKSGLMVGLGERREEVLEVLSDLRGAGCSAVTIGQYLQPEQGNLPVYEYVTPETFKEYEVEARRVGFSYVASGPYVRSSYMAHQGYEALMRHGNFPQY